jgi:hypothetical protein
VRAALAGLVALLGALPLSAWGLRPVRIYEVDLEEQSPTAVQNAMRQALVRATGRRESADDPALAAVIADAARYVKSYASGPRGEPQVVFDAVAVAQAIDTAGLELERAATERGLPISVIPLTVIDAAGNTLDASALMQSAQRYGGDQVLVGRADAGGVAAGQLQWTLYTRAQSETWTGPLSAGIDHAVDLEAPPPGAAGEAAAPARVRVEGVAGLADYAAVERLLQSIAGVRRAEVAEVDAGSVTFEVQMRGGSAALERELSGSTHFAPGASGGARLVYRYQPQG